MEMEDGSGEVEGSDASAAAANSPQKLKPRDAAKALWTESSSNSAGTSKQGSSEEFGFKSSVVEVTVPVGPLGVILNNGDPIAQVANFIPVQGQPGLIEKSGKVPLGSVIIEVNGVGTVDKNCGEVIELLKQNAQVPRTIKFKIPAATPKQKYEEEHTLQNPPPPPSKGQSDSKEVQAQANDMISNKGLGEQTASILVVVTTNEIQIHPVALPDAIALTQLGKQKKIHVSPPPVKYVYSASTFRSASLVSLGFGKLGLVCVTSNGTVLCLSLVSLTHMRHSNIKILNQPLHGAEGISFSSARYVEITESGDIFTITSHQVGATGTKVAHPLSDSDVWPFLLYVTGALSEYCRSCRD
jgi:hypothetical protein